jgi:8-oxo-dGTP diphosphatase
MITVVAAVVARGGSVLVCQRRRDDSFPLRWEFPGGKVQAGETPADALARELEEELGVRARIGAELHRTRHRYAEMADEIELLFFAASLGEQEPANLAFEQILWADVARLAELDFLPADRELISLLSSGSLRVA